MKILFRLTVFAAALTLYAKEPVFNWYGDVLRGTRFTGNRFSVPPSANIRAYLRYELLKETPGFRFLPYVIFEDASGKITGRLDMGENLPDPVNSHLIDAELYCKVPAGTVKAYFSLDFYGNPGSIRIKEEKIHVSLPPVREKMRYKPLARPLKMTDAQLDKHLNKRLPAHAKIVRRGEYNTIEVNGKEITPSIYLTTGYKTGLRYSMIQEYAASGVRIVSCSASLGIGRPNKALTDIWLGDGKYDINALQKELRKILREFPDACILLNLDVSPYRGYLEKYPGEAYCDRNGDFVGFYHGYARKTGKKLFTSKKGEDSLNSLPSYYSRHYAESAAKALHDICKMISATPEGKAVIAVYLNGGTDGQWYDQFDTRLKITADGSPAGRRAFKVFLQKKYDNNIDKLRRAWRNKTVTFDGVELPQHNELWNKEKSFHTLHQTASLLSDYCEFLGTAFAERHILWCKAVKSGSGDRFLAGSYFNNSGLRGYPQLGHQSLRLLLKAPEVELLATVPGYRRNLREPVHQGGFSGSLVRNGKLQITELDLRTGELPYWGRWGMPFWRSHNPAERFALDALRFAASAISKGGTFHIYDMEGGVFNSSNARNAWQKAILLLNERVPAPLDEKHIAVISSEKFWNYQSFAKNRITAYTVRETPLHALYRSGVKHFEYVLEDVFDKDFKAPRVMIFLDAGTLTVAQASAIRKKFGKDGRVICWMWAPGMFTDDGDKNISAITGFKLKRSPGADNRPLVAEPSAVSPFLKHVRGFLFPYTPEYLHGWGIAYAVDDPDAKIIASYYKTRIPGGAVKQYADHTELYFGAPGSLTPQLCRNMARSGKVHIYLESDDFSDINAGLLSLSALSTGIKHIYLPPEVEEVKVLTGQKIKFKHLKASVEMKTGELLILKMIRKNKMQERTRK